MSVLSVNSIFVIIAFFAISVKSDETCNPDYCLAAKCRNAEPNECTSTQRFEARDVNNCICCSRCVDCDPNDCHLMDCMPVTKESCEKKGEILAPRDGVCNCCDRCIKDCSAVLCADTTEEKCQLGEKFVPKDDHNCCSYCKKTDSGCDDPKPPKITCANVRCMNVNREDCKEGQVFLPLNGKNRCCNQCVTKPKE